MRFDIAALNLKPGIYGVTLWLSHAVGKPIDEVPAFELEVLETAQRGLGVSTGALVQAKFRITAMSEWDPAP